MRSPGEVVAVCASPTHSFHKPIRDLIRLVNGLGVEGDAHCGRSVRHRSRVAIDPTRPNLRQVHLIHLELIEELRASSFEVAPGQMGENVTTRGLDLLGLPVGSLLRLGDEAVVEVTGLRNPCAQLDAFRPGLKSALLGRDADGRVVRKAGIMGVVQVGGVVRPGDAIEIELPPVPHSSLECV
jgi:hypothetical protein